MAAAKFYVIYTSLNSKSGNEELEETMDKALDWFRFNKEFWVVYSTSEPEKWYRRLSHLVKDGGNTFICELNVNNRQGWMPRSFWKWLRQER